MKKIAQETKVEPSFVLGCLQESLNEFSSIEETMSSFDKKIRQIAQEPGLYMTDFRIITIAAMQHSEDEKFKKPIEKFQVK